MPPARQVVAAWPPSRATASTQSTAAAARNTAACRSLTLLSDPRAAALRLRGGAPGAAPADADGVTSQALQMAAAVRRRRRRSSHRQGSPRQHTPQRHGAAESRCGRVATLGRRQERHRAGDRV